MKEGRSASAFIIEKALKIKKNRKVGQDGTFKKAEEKPYVLPRMVYKSKVALESFADCQVIETFTPSSSSGSNRTLPPSRGQELKPSLNR